MKNIVMGSNDGAMIYWRLMKAFQEDPLVSMLSDRAYRGIAKAFHEATTDGDKIVLRPAEPNIKMVMRGVLVKAPLGWVGDEFKEHVAAVAIQALIPEGE